MRARGSNGRLDFLKLPTLAFDLAGEYFAKDLHRVDALLRLSDAAHNGRVRWHMVLVGFTGLDELSET